MSMCESILTIALVCTVKYLHYCDYYYTLGNDSQSTPKLIAYQKIRTVSRPYITSHIYHFPLHNLLCRNPNTIYKPNHFIDPFTFHFDTI